MVRVEWIELVFATRSLFKGPAFQHGPETTFDSIDRIVVWIEKDFGWIVVGFAVGRLNTSYSVAKRQGSAVINPELRVGSQNFTGADGNGLVQKDFLKFRKKSFSECLQFSFVLANLPIDFICLAKVLIKFDGN